MKTYYQNLTTFTVREKLSQSKLFIAIGTIEQHGPHLPLSVDVDIPYSVIDFVAEPYHGIIAPSINFGSASLPHSGGGPSFDGTITIPGKLLIDYYASIFTSYKNSGAKEIIILNGHYENEAFIFEALQNTFYATNSDVKIIAVSWWNLISNQLIAELFGNEFPGWHAEHAGLTETSLMMCLKPELVQSERPDNINIPRAGVYIYPIDIEKISNRGVLSYTSQASKQKGEILFQHICRNFMSLIDNPYGTHTEI